MPKYVLKRKYKNYTDPYAIAWYNAIYDPNFVNNDYSAYNNLDVGYNQKSRGLEQKQAALNAADYVESMYRYHQRKYKSQRDSAENNPNFIGPKTPNNLIPESIKQGLQFSNYDSRRFGAYNDNYPDLPEDYDKYKLGGIYIKPENRGKFTAWAERHNMGVQEAANHILANKDNYPSTLVQRANFAKNFGGRKKADLGTQYPLIGGVQPLNFTVPTFTPLTPISPLNISGLTGNYRNLFNQNINAGVLSTAISGLGRLGNYLAINSFKPKMQHTEVQAEQAEKAPTTYSINAQRDNLARSIAEGTRDINNNTASSQVAEARRSILRNRGIGAFNNIYEGKLNRETEMLRADAQLRQEVRQRNTAALNNAVARDTAYNTSLINQSNLMKKQALGNLFTGVASDSINTINQLGNTYYNLLSNQQQLDRDIATASLYFLANRNAGNLFTPDKNGNSIYDNVYNNVRRAWYGKLGGYNSLIRR